MKGWILTTSYITVQYCSFAKRISALHRELCLETVRGTLQSANSRSTLHSQREDSGTQSSDTLIHSCIQVRAASRYTYRPCTHMLTTTSIASQSHPPQLQTRLRHRYHQVSRHLCSTPRPAVNITRIHSGRLPPFDRHLQTIIY